MMPKSRPNMPKARLQSTPWIRNIDSEDENRDLSAAKMKTRPRTIESHRKTRPEASQEKRHVIDKLVDDDTIELRRRLSVLDIDQREDSISEISDYGSHDRTKARRPHSLRLGIQAYQTGPTLKLPNLETIQQAREQVQSPRLQNDNILEHSRLFHPSSRAKQAAHDPPTLLLSNQEQLIRSSETLQDPTNGSSIRYLGFITRTIINIVVLYLFAIAGILFLIHKGSTTACLPLQNPLAEIPSSNLSMFNAKPLSGDNIYWPTILHPIPRYLTLTSSLYDVTNRTYRLDHSYPPNATGSSIAISEALKSALSQAAWSYEIMSSASGLSWALEELKVAQMGYEERLKSLYTGLERLDGVSLVMRTIERYRGVDKRGLGEWIRAARGVGEAVNLQEKPGMGNREGRSISSVLDVVEWRMGWAVEYLRFATDVGQREELLREDLMPAGEVLKFAKVVLEDVRRWNDWVRTIRFVVQEGENGQPMGFIESAIVHGGRRRAEVARDEACWEGVEAFKAGLRTVLGR